LQKSFWDLKIKEFNSQFESIKIRWVTGEARTTNVKLGETISAFEDRGKMRKPESRWPAAVKFY
jgi:hypothetical protein